MGCDYRRAFPLDAIIRAIFSDMPIDPPILPPFSSASSAETGSARSGPLEMPDLTRLLGHGRAMAARVETVTPLSREQRQQLLDNTINTLLRLTRNDSPPADRAQQLNRLDAQQQLLQTSGLQLASLRLLSRELLTYTDRPLAPGQQVLVRLDPGGRLVLTDKPPERTQPRPDGRAPTAPGERTPASAQGATPSRNTNPAVADTDRTQLRALRETSLADTLRQILPLRDTRPPLYAELNRLVQAQHAALLPPPVRTALLNLAQQLPEPKQLTQPNNLTATLRNSGVLFERKLAPLAAPTTEAGNTGKIAPARGDIKGALLQLLQRVNAELPASQRPGVAPGNAPITGNVPMAGNASAPGAAQIPAAGQTVVPPLLTTAPPQSTFASVAPPPAASGTATDTTTSPAVTPSTTPGTSGDMATTPTLGQLLLHMSARPAAELSSRVLRAQLMLLLHQQTLQALGKVRLQQLHSVSHQLAQSDAPQPTQSWLFDLPVRYGQDVRPLEIRIDDEWVEDGEGEERRKKRQWQVILSFDLPDTGAFHAQLTLLDDQLSARFWAEQTETLSIANRRLERLRKRLEADGVTVTKLQCLEGQPPSRKPSFNYALVDVRT